EQMEEGRADLRGAPSRRGLLSRLRFGSLERLSAGQGSGESAERVSRTEGRVGPRLLVRLGQQLPWREAAPGFADRPARSRRRCGGGRGGWRAPWLTISPEPAARRQRGRRVCRHREPTSPKW